MAGAITTTTTGSGGSSSASPLNINSLPTGSFSVAQAAPLNVNTLPAGSFTVGTPAGAEDEKGSVQQYADESANPASNSNNPTPSGWQSFWAGKPLNPVTAPEAKGLVDIGRDVFGGLLGDLIPGFKDVPTKSDVANAVKGGVSIISNLPTDVFGAIGGLANGVKDLITHPIKTVQNLATFAKGIAEDGTGAIKQGISTGDWSQLNDDVQKGIITAGNHPVQAALAADMVAGGVENVGKLADAAQDAGAAATTPGLNFSDTPTGQKIAAMRSNISNLFNSGHTTLDEHTVALGNLTDKVIADNKAYTDAKNTVQSFQDQIDQTRQSQADLQKQLQIADVTTREGLQKSLDENKAKSLELEQNMIKARKALQTAQDTVKQSFDAKTKEVNTETANQQSEARLKSAFNDTTGAPSESEMGSGVKQFFQHAFSRASGVYDETLGNAKIDTDPIVNGFTDYKKALLAGNKFRSADSVDAVTDQLKLRDIINNPDKWASRDSLTPTEKALEDARSQEGKPAAKALAELQGESDKSIPFTLEKALKDSGIDPKSYEGMDLDELKERYQPLTSDNLKTSRNAIYDSIKANANESSAAEYEKTVSPAFKSSFEKAIKDNYGDGRLAQIKEVDKNWAELKNNPLSKDDAPKLDKIAKNWDAFSKSAEKVPGGANLVERIRNFTADRVLSDAENLANKGTFNYNKILSGVDKYGNVLGDTLTERLTRVAEDNKNIEDETQARADELKSTKQQLGETGKQQKLNIAKEKETINKEGGTAVKNIKSSLKSISEQMSKTEQDAKDVGSDKPDFIKNVQKIDSPEKLQSFLDKSGKSPQELGAVVIRQAFEGAGKEIGANRLEAELDTKGKPVLDENGKPIIKAPNYNADRVDQALKDINKLGGGDQQVQNRLLGQTEEMESKGQISETQKQLRVLKDAYDKYQTAKDASSKTLAQRAMNLATGLLFVTVAPIGKFFGFRKILSAFAPDASTAEDIAATARVAGKVKSAIPGTLEKLGEVGTVGSVAQKANGDQASP